MNLEEMEKQVDKILANETKESMSEWLNKRRKNSNKNKIIEILFKYSEEVNIKSNILSISEKEDWIWSGNFENIAKEIEELYIFI